MKQRTPMNKISTKRQRESRIYAQKRKAFLAAHPVCQVWLKENGWEEAWGWGFPVFTYEVDANTYRTVDEAYVLAKGAPTSVDVHHMKGRGRYYLDETTWLAVSREAHEKIGRYPKWAEQQGYLDPQRNVRSSFLK